MHGPERHRHAAPQWLLNCCCQDICCELLCGPFLCCGGSCCAVERVLDGTGCAVHSCALLCYQEACCTVMDVLSGHVVCFWMCCPFLCSAVHSGHVLYYTGSAVHSLLCSFMLSGHAVLFRSAVQSCALWPCQDMSRTGRMCCAFLCCCAARTCDAHLCHALLLTACICMCALDPMAMPKPPLCCTILVASLCPAATPHSSGKHGSP